MIYSLSWSPSEAAVPIPLLLLAYELMIIPLGLFSIYKTIVGSNEENDGRRWQFNLRSVFATTLVVAVICAIARLSYGYTTDVLFSVAIAFCALTIVAVCAVGCYATRHYFCFKTP